MLPWASKIISICWLIFGVVWMLAAFTTKRTVYRESAGRRLRYTVPIAIGIFLLLRGWRFSFPLGLIIIPHMDSAAVAGVILCLIGLAFCLWARFVLGRNWSGTVTLKDGHELIQRGPYQLVRHPIYTGLLTMVLGHAIAAGHLAGFIGTVIVGVSFWIKLGDEEAVMLRQFPGQYPAYQQRVKRIIPFVL